MADKAVQKVDDFPDVKSNKGKFFNRQKNYDGSPGTATFTKYLNEYWKDSTNDADKILVYNNMVRQHRLWMRPDDDSITSKEKQNAVSFEQAFEESKAFVDKYIEEHKNKEKEKEKA